MSGRTRRDLLLCCSLVAWLGCDDSSSAGDVDAGEHAGHGADASTDVENQDVPCTSEYPTFRPGLETKSGVLSVRLISVTPEPPRQKVRNNWVIEILDREGSPISSATISNPASYMEVHRHYGKSPPTVVEQSEPGRYAFENIDFKMRGPWQLLFDVKVGSAPLEPVVLKICVE